MLFNKKLNVLLLLLLVLVMITTTTVVNADTNNSEQDVSQEVIYQVPEGEYKEAIESEVINTFEQVVKDDMGVSDDYNLEISKEPYIKTLNSLDNEIVAKAANPSNDYEYRTYLHEDKAKLQAGGYKTASGQLQGGYKGASYLYYSTSGGSRFSFTISFKAPWSPVSVGTTYGKGSNKDIGMAVKTTSTKVYNKVQASKTYKATPYSIQKRKKGGSWVTFSRGVATKYYRVAARCVKV